MDINDFDLEGDEDAEELIKPTQFIYFKDGKFHINEEVEEGFRKITDDVHVIAVVGKYRTGKSYFLNRLFGTQEKGGFRLGKTIESATKGLWCWVKRMNGKVYVLLDSEGLYVTTTGTNFDNKIVSLCLLLCSIFILNTTGNIDRKSISQLLFVVELTKHIKTYSTKENKPGDFQEVFPHFVWLVRDFFLELRNDRGEYLTDNEYLEEMLHVTEKQQRSLDEGMQKVVQTKTFLKKMFPKRSCFTLSTPLNDTKELHRLFELPYSSLEEKFTQKMDVVADFILSRCSEKAMFSKTWNGALFFSMAASFVASVNSSRFIALDSSFGSVVAGNNKKLFSRAVALYIQGMESRVSLPMNSRPLLKIHSEELKKAVLYFSSGVYEDEAELREEKVDKFEKHLVEVDKETGSVSGGVFFDHFVARNTKLSKEKCTKLMKELWEEIVQKEYNDLVKRDDPLEEYDELVANVKEQYFSTQNLGPASKEAFLEFEESKKNDKSHLVVMGNMMKEQREMLAKTESDLREKEEKLRRINEKREREREEEERKIAEKKRLEEVEKLKARERERQRVGEMFGDDDENSSGSQPVDQKSALHEIQKSGGGDNSNCFKSSF